MDCDTETMVQSNKDDTKLTSPPNSTKKLTKGERAAAVFEEAHSSEEEAEKTS